MVEQPAIQRPKVRGTVILTVFLAALQFLSAWLNSAINNSLQTPPLVYVNIGVGILLLIAAILIARYKRLGLIIGLVVYAWLILGFASLILGGGVFAIDGILTLIFVVAAVYYMFIYLTRTPEKDFFT